MSQYPPGQQPQYPQQQGYPQGQIPQQYPAPYSPYQVPQVHPMAYAQAQMQGLGGRFSRAGMMLIITGSLMALCGLGCGALAMGPLEQMLAETPMDPKLAAMMTPQMIKMAFILFSVGSLMYSVLAIIFGVMVRRQSKAGAIGGIVLSGLVIAYLLFNMLMSIVQMGVGAQTIMGECVLIVPLAVIVWQLMWLIGALRTAGPLRAMEGQMQMQYWQMMQMQQAQQQQYQQMMANQQQGLPQQQATQPQAQQNPEVRIQNSEEKKDGEEDGGQV